MIILQDYEIIDDWYSKNAIWIRNNKGPRKKTRLFWSTADDRTLYNDSWAPQVWNKTHFKSPFTTWHIFYGKFIIERTISISWFIFIRSSMDPCVIHFLGLYKIHYFQISMFKIVPDIQSIPLLLPVCSLKLMSLIAIFKRSTAIDPFDSLILKIQPGSSMISNTKIQKKTLKVYLW